MLSRVLLLLTFTLALSAPVVADSRDQLARAMNAWLAYDYSTALRGFLPLGEQGDVTAQKFLGGMYEKGQGTAPDPVQAARWYRLAANRGDPQSQISLGLLYMQGLGVRQDNVQAYMWWMIAGAHDPADMKLVHGFLAMTARAMTADQIAWAEKLARDWKPVE